MKGHLRGRLSGLCKGFRKASKKLSTHFFADQNKTGPSVKPESILLAKYVSYLPLIVCQKYKKKIIEFRFLALHSFDFLVYET